MNPSDFEIGLYDPCPCGSGAKYKFCCAAKARAKRHGKFPIGTVALYGPDDKVTTKIAAGIILGEAADPIMERWVASDVTTNPKVVQEIKAFFAKHGVKSVAMVSGNLGCPHEEEIDFPLGEDCPFCPFWAGKQGTARVADDEDLTEDDDGLDHDDEAGEPRKATLIPFTEAESDELERDFEANFARINAVLGDPDLDFAAARERWVAHLQANLQLPCEVTGTEDFRWEEPYVIGGWSRKEHQRLKNTQPSFDDRYQLLGIDPAARSKWIMFSEDIAALVKRTSDGKRFVLGLAELEATDKQSPQYQMLEDYSVWLVNSL